MRLGVASAVVDGVVVPGDVEVDEGRIAAVGLVGTRGSGTAVPGLVDLQVNGFAGVDLRRADPQGYGAAALELARRGTTAVAPTFYSQSVPAYLDSLAVLAEVHAAPPSGCRFLGAHLEGPFLAPERRGAHDELDLLAADPGVLEQLLGAGPVDMVTLSPELPGALGLVRELVRRRVVVGLGHTDAATAEVRRAVGAGARHLTHCWNAMRAPTARDPGPVGVALDDPRVTVGLIVDLVHVAPALVRATLAVAGGRVAATTDAVAEAGRMEGAAGVRLDDGTLAGGTAGPDECLRNLVACGATLPEALHACGGAQRRLLGLAGGRLRPGDVAELTVLDDGLHVRRTVVGTWATEAA